MIGIVIATHGSLSDGLKDAANVVIGSVERLETVNLNLGDSVDELGDKIAEAIHKVDDDDGVIVLADLLGASPYNQTVLATRKLKEDVQRQVHLIAGVNFPMVLEAINHQLLDTNVKEVVQAIVEAGKKGIESWNVLSSVIDEEEEEF